MPPWMAPIAAPPADDYEFDDDGDFRDDRDPSTGVRKAVALMAQGSGQVATTDPPEEDESDDGGRETPN